MTGPDTHAVREHYAELAADYDRRANRACKRAYAALVAEKLAGAKRVLELGAGSTPLAPVLGAPCSVACDLSQAMLARAATANRAVADGCALPFHDAAFDAVFSINVLEHVPDVPAFFRESARVLTPGGRFLAVTPNGDAAWLLDWLERLRLKLPEGPHRFLTRTELLAHAGTAFDTVEHRRFLTFPAGPPALVATLDRITRTGLFQYVLLRKRA